MHAPAKCFRSFKTALPRRHQQMKFFEDSLNGPLAPVIPAQDPLGRVADRWGWSAVFDVIAASGGGALLVAAAWALRAAPRAGATRLDAAR